MCFCAKFWPQESTNVESYESLESEVDDGNIDLVLTLSGMPDACWDISEADCREMRCCLTSYLVAAGPPAALRDILDGICRNLISYSHCAGKVSPLQSALFDFSGRGKYPQAGGFSCRKRQLLSPSPSHSPKLIPA